MQQANGNQYNRWKALTAWVKANPPPPQSAAQQHKKDLQLQKQHQQQQQEQLQQQHQQHQQVQQHQQSGAADILEHRKGVVGDRNLYRVFTEEYKGANGNTRRFLVASYSVS